MNRAYRRKIFTALRFFGVVLSCGLIGLALGVSVAFRVSAARTSDYAQDLLRYAETFANEINATLDKVNASPYPMCSDDDIARLRYLVFHGHLVKDIGRTNGGMLYCTSLSGRLSQPVPEIKPDIVMPSGRSVSMNAPLAGTPGMFGDITHWGQAEFVAAHDAFEHLRQPPMIYSTTLTNRITRKILRTAGAPLRLTNDEIFAEKEFVRDNTLYVARCSAQYAPCMVAGITLYDVWRTNGSLITGFVSIGTMAGIALGLTLLLQPYTPALGSQLRRAIRRNLITVVYQPIVDAKTRHILGVEALARWKDDEGQYVRPDVFVAAAEELGFIGKLTRVVLALVVAELGDCLRANPDFYVNVNISAGDLADPNFLPMLERVLEKNSIPSKSINLELTERSTADHELAIASIRSLRASGHKLFIDDFGTGYSSLSYLNELAVDAIKIDRAFTDAIGTGSLTAAIVPQVLDMARTLNIKVVVEGVERPDQSNYFANLDYDVLAQGWHFGEPVSAKELLILLESQGYKTPVPKE